MPSVGIALAWVGIRQLLALSPDNIPRANTVAVDVAVLMFAVVIALAAAFVFALVPAVTAFRLDLVPALSGVLRLMIGYERLTVVEILIGLASRDCPHARDAGDARRRWACCVVVGED